MQPVRLDDVASLPGEFLMRLRALDSVFTAHEYVDSVAADPRVRRLVADLEEHLRALPVHG